jgi:hypothetical protein
VGIEPTTAAPFADNLLSFLVSILKCKTQQHYVAIQKLLSGTQSDAASPFPFEEYFAVHCTNILKNFFTSLLIMQRWPPHYAAYLRSEKIILEFVSII